MGQNGLFAQSSLDPAGIPCARSFQKTGFLAALLAGLGKTLFFCLEAALLAGIFWTTTSLLRRSAQVGPAGGTLCVSGSQLGAECGVGPAALVHGAQPSLGTRGCCAAAAAHAVCTSNQRFPEKEAVILCCFMFIANVSYVFRS